jgi:hypothetical protein
MSTIDDRINDEKEHIQQVMIKFKTEPTYCRKFGCGRILTLEEQRLGDHCMQHWDADEVPTIKDVKIKWR